MNYSSAELVQHEDLRDRGKDPRTYFWRYHNRKDLVDIELVFPAERDPSGNYSDQGMRPLKFHCIECKLIFGYDRPVDCPGCGAKDSMRPGKPGILVSHKEVLDEQ